MVQGIRRWARWAVAAGMTLGLVTWQSGCHDEATCKSNDDCASGYHCEGDRCVADDGGVVDGGDGAVESCESWQDCHDETKPICDEGTHECRGCKASSECEAISHTSPYCNEETGACSGACGNGVLDEGESCDGSELGQATCQSEAGMSEGQLRCNESCQGYDTTGCYECGNGTVEGPEVCDGGDLGGASCEDMEGYSGGSLACTGDCLGYDVTGCWTCGDQVCSMDLGETADNCAMDCGAVSVCAGGAHSCVVLADGTAWCWGSNRSGQLGTGTAGGQSLMPVPVEGLTGVESITCGADHTCAVTTNGELYCWGANTSGQIGNGNAGGNEPTPTLVDVASATIVSASAGGAHSCAVTSDDDLYCWGDNRAGQLGLGNTSLGEETPQPVPSPSAVVQVTAGDQHTCAVGRNASPWCWGSDDSGQMGDGDENHQPGVGTEISGMAGTASQMAAGGAHTCAVTSSHLLYCWGENSFGQLGIGNTNQSTVPVSVTDLQSTASVSAGGSHSCAVDSQGAAWCWGQGVWGQLGSGDNSDAHSPVAVVDVSSVAAVSAGGEHSCAIDGQGMVWCWGLNARGQLGDGSTTSANRPVQVQW